MDIKRYKVDYTVGQYPYSVIVDCRDPRRTMESVFARDGLLNAVIKSITLYKTR